MTDLPVFVMDRVFDAPRELVWKTWTEAEHLARWYGPNVKTVIHQLDVRPGGEWLNEMQMQGRSNFEKMAYVEVIPPEKLVWLHSVTDSEWNIAPNPMMPDWPRVLLTTVTFSENGNQTNLRLTWEPHDATQAEITCFASAIGGLHKGWGAGMQILEELLVELQN